MDLVHHYNKLWEQASEKFKKSEFTLDSLIYSVADNRLGVTLLLRPPEHVLNSIALFQNELRKYEPDLYYQPLDDIHITVLSIISCYEGFQITDINVEKHIELIQQSLNGFLSFDIQFKGITASTSALMIQGFPSNNQLNQIRDSLRTYYANSDQLSRMDVRYAITTAHSTIVRFPKKPQNPENLVELIEKYRDFDFGTFEVKHLEFVFNDWYQKEKKVKTLAKFKL